MSPNPCLWYRMLVVTTNFWLPDTMPVRSKMDHTIAGGVVKSQDSTLVLSSDVQYVDAAGKTTIIMSFVETDTTTKSEGHG